MRATVKVAMELKQTRESEAALRTLCHRLCDTAESSFLLDPLSSTEIDAQSTPKDLCAKRRRVRPREPFGVNPGSPGIYMS